MVDRAALRDRLAQLSGYTPPDEELDEVGSLLEAVEALPPVCGVEAPEPAVAFVPLAQPGLEE